MSRIESWKGCVVAVGVFLGILTACENTSTPTSSGSPISFASTDITGVQFGRGFSLTDHTGVVRSLADFKGKAVVLFLGYTHCPDICPATMAEIASAMEKLGSAKERVQVLFVTLDPERDNPTALKQYVSSFNPSFLGLYGDEEATLEIVREFKAVSQKNHEGATDLYTVEHSGGIYIFDPAGRLRLHAREHKDGGETLARDLAKLLNTAA